MRQNLSTTSRPLYGCGLLCYIFLFQGFLRPSFLNITAKQQTAPLLYLVGHKTFPTLFNLITQKMKRHFVKAIMAAMCFSAITSTALFTGCKDDDEVKIIHDTVTVINTNYDTIVNIKEGGNIFIVSYSSEYGTQPGSVIVRQDGKLAEKNLRPISADGHTFLGWFLDGKKVESGLSVSSDITLTAQWSDETYELFLDDKSAKLDDIYDLKSGRHTIKVTGTMTHILYSQIATALRENPDVQFDVDMGETEGLKVAADTYYDVYEYMGFGVEKDAVQNLMTIILPKKLESISSGAFSDCELLEKVSLPDGLLEIGRYAFSNTNLSEVIIPSSVKNMAGNAFDYCKNLKSLVILDKTREVNLYGMNSLTSLTLSSTVTNVSLETPLLKELILPNNVTDVYLNACNSLSSLSFPNGIKTIQLSNCNGLSSLTIPEGTEMFELSECENIVSVSFPTSLTSLNVKSCKKISTTEVSIPKNVKGGFLQCWSSLTTLTILANNFQYEPSKALKNVIYGPNVSEIDRLYVVNEETTFTIQSATPPALEIYNYLPNTTIIKVPSSSVNAYKAAEIWSEYADLIVGY